jgi:hypothetical protein
MEYMLISAMLKHHFMTWTPPSRIAVAAGTAASEGGGRPSVTVAGGGGMIPFNRVASNIFL